MQWLMIKQFLNQTIRRVRQELYVYVDATTDSQVLSAPSVSSMPLQG